MLLDGHHLPSARLPIGGIGDRHFSAWGVKPQFTGLLPDNRRADAGPILDTEFAVKRVPSEEARLRAAVTRALEKPKADRRVTTGATDIIRKLLPVIEEMRREGVAWRAIAEALADQGVTESHEGGHWPISARRVSAIIADIVRQRDRKAGKLSARLNRPDVASPRRDDVRNELVRPDEPLKPPNGSDLASTEEQRIRQAAFDDFLKLTNGDHSHE